MVKADLSMLRAEGGGERYLVTAWCCRYAIICVTWFSVRVLYPEAKSLILDINSCSKASCVCSSEKL